MDTEQEKFQYLGFLGIFKEAFNITTSHKKIFTQITLSVILPLSFIYVSQNEISGFVFGENEISPSKDVTDDTQMGSRAGSTVKPTKRLLRAPNPKRASKFLYLYMYI